MNLWLLVTLLASAGLTQTASPPASAAPAPGAPAPAAPASVVDSLGILGPPAPAPGGDLFAGFS
jgi:hypothetical protein